MARRHASPADRSERVKGGADPVAQGGRPLPRILAIVAAMGWCWAIGLVAPRWHLVVDYQVVSGAPPIWGFMALSPWMLGLIGASGLALGIACSRTDGRKSAIRSAAWLAAGYAIPAADAARTFGIAIPYTMFEPLFLVAITGLAVEDVCRGSGDVGGFLQRVPSVACPCVVWGLTLAAGGWWFHQGVEAYDNYLLGYHDFGHFARRVVNTWEGRGFLRETPSLPAFWDHFNPGLALIAPVWAAWPDPKFFIVLQAVCLSLPAVFVYAIARTLHASPAPAAAWAAAYLLYPVVGLLNLSFSYGWHPESCALPLMFAAILALLRGLPIVAGALGLLACSFGETVVVAVGCLAATQAVAAWHGRRQGRIGHSQNESHQTSTLAATLSPWAWLAIWLAATVAFSLIYRFAGLADFQTARVARQLDPAALFRPGAAYLLLALLLPLGVRAVLAGWPILLAAALPLCVLCAWTYPHATSIGSQYSTTLIPLLVAAAIAGGARQNRDRHGAAWAALAATTVGAVCFGAFPWSARTSLIDEITYPAPQRDSQVDDRSTGTPGNEYLNQIVGAARSRDSRVLATSRIAAHLIGIERLDTVNDAVDRWQALSAEAGPNRSPIELFDWVLLDTREQFQQSPAETQWIADQARGAGYVTEVERHEIIVLKRAATADPTFGPSRTTPRSE